MTRATFHTVTTAAKRVKRSRQTIETWITQGLPVIHIKKGNRTTRYINETDLLKVYRDKLRNNPSRPTQQPQND